MVVEGFRRSDSNVMDAYEYFFRDGVAVGRAPAGTMVYDARPGHQHWHFEQFARYSLLASDHTSILRSRKEAFCLAPTDALDLTVPNAEWNPYSIGLTGACGDAGSIWVRETLPVGWGDTYFQSLPGQSFDITTVPNGTYYIEVRANPLGLLKEADTIEQRATARDHAGRNPRTPHGRRAGVAGYRRLASGLMDRTSRTGSACSSGRPIPT